MSDYDPIVEGSSLDGDDGFIIRLDSGNPQRGLQVSAAGDVNGDGFQDFMVGQQYGPATYVVFGHAGGWDANLYPDKLDGSDGFALTGAGGYSDFGGSISAGDINGDGINDVIVGARAAYDGSSRPGAAYVVFGHAGDWDALLSAASLDGSNGFRLSGAGDWSQFGLSVAALGDVNGDGFGDLVVGKYDRYGSGPVGYVVYGKAGGWDSDLDLDTLDPSQGFALTIDGGHSASIFKAAAAGDVNHDGAADLLVSTYDNDTSTSRVRLVFGQAGGFGAGVDLSTLDGSNGVSFTEADDSTFVGRALASAGDINGDGFDDMAFGDYVAQPDQPGRVYVVFGHDGAWDASINVDALDGANGFTLTGWQDFQRLGISVSSAGDFNGDGYDDLIVGAQGANGWEGAAYVLFGHPGAWDASYNLAALDGDNGFQIVGDDSHAYTGTTVSSAGDINGDGFSDLLVTTFAGRDDHSRSLTYVIFGHGPGDAGDRVGNGLDQTIQGGDFGDTLSGRGGADHLLGNGGSDTLTGGAGADTLQGGLGADVLIGGQGADRFVFASTLESKGAAFDLVEDLQHADLIDLSAIDADRTLDGDQAFAIVSRFSGHAGELEVHFDHADGHTVIKGDIDGDGRADMRIEVVGHVADAAFVL